MKEIIADLINKQIDIPREQLISLIEMPPDPKLGDYSFPCFSLAKELKKSPVEIALQIANSIDKGKDFEKIQATGPYVNFFISRKKLAEDTLKEILKKKDKYGSGSNSDKKTILVEYSQANTHKAFHIGHVRGTSLGESLARIAEFQGNKALRANYQGDTGMHVAKWIWCFTKFHADEKPKKDEEWIASIYVEAVRRLADNPDLQEEVNEINRKLESKEDKKLNSLWEKTRKLSLESFEIIYKELNTHFDRYFFESEVEERAKKISLELAKKGIAEISEGATIMRLDSYGLGVWILLRKDGTVLYSAKDLALAERKMAEYKLDRSVHIVGKEQELHFHQLFKTLELAGMKKNCELVYLPVTEVRLPSGKMSSRSGENILYSSFKKEIVSYAKEEILKREKLPEKDLQNRALAIAISSLKYSMLKQDLNKSIVFDKAEALSFEGNTGPYLLYSYARAKSILAKSKKKPSLSKIPEQISEQEKDLIMHLSKFTDIVKHAYENFAPNIIANYAYQLAQQFNAYYHSTQVIGSEEEAFRLALVESSSQVLKNSLSLLGIPVIEKM